MKQLWRHWRGRRTADRAAGHCSLRRRLLVSVLGASVTVWLVSLAIVVTVAWRESSEVFDDALEESARLALVLGIGLQAGGTPQPAAREAGGDPLKLKIYYQLVAPNGRVLHRADDAPRAPFVRDFTQRKGHRNVRIDGDYWRVYVQRDPVSGLQAQVGQPWDERAELLEEMAEKLAWPALGLLLLLGGFCWFVIRRLLAPLERAAAGIAAKSPQDLTPVSGAGQPRELQPIVDALNALLARLSGALALEPVDLASLFAGLDTSAAQAHGITVQRDAQAATVMAHPALLASALRNLLDNALRYGAPGGRVQISAAPMANGGVRIAVSDDGPGVTPADRTRLGERFFRVLGTGQTGNGLGLSIVARIAALHGATLRFEEGLQGRGLGVVLEFAA